MEGEQAATGLAAIDQFRIATADQRRVGVKQGGEVAGAAAEDREDAGNVVARVGSGGQEELDAGGEALGGAGIGVDDIIERGAAGLGVAAVGVGAVVEKPLERFRLEILARSEESREPAPPKSVDVGAVPHQ